MGYEILDYRHEIIDMQKQMIDITTIQIAIGKEPNITGFGHESEYFEQANRPW